MRGRLLVLIGCALFAGCGSTRSHTASSATKSTAATIPNPTARLEQAVRQAVASNASLSNWVLWHNSVPAWAVQSTAGPALAALRGSAAERQHQHLQMLGISPHFDVLSVTLAPSYTAATVIVRERGNVRPYRNGKPLGRPIKVDENARLELRRSGTALRFVVWKVESAR